MGTQRFALATLAGGVTMFVLGFLIWGLLFMDFFLANAGTATGAMREVPVFWALGLGQILFAAVLVLILEWRGATSVVAGLKTGALVGLLLGFAFDLSMFGTMNTMTLTAALVDPFLSMIQVGLTGAVVGALLGRREEPVPA